MSNPMLDMLSRGSPQQFAGPGNMSGGPMQMMQQFAQFKRMMQGRNPQQMELREAMCGVVRYPMATTYTSGGNPFCGCNNGCNI